MGTGTRRGMRLGSLVAAVGLGLSGTVAWVAPAAAAAPAGTRPDSMPQWIPPRIDHPTPATDPLPQVLTAPSTVPGTVITPTQAAAIVSTVWDLRTIAFGTDDRSLMAEFESGPALESDEVTCGCNSRDVRGAIDAVSLFVPEQPAYPASFLAEVRTTLLGGFYLQYLVLARASPESPWKVVADPGESGLHPLDQPKVGPGGFDVAGPSGLSARRLPARLASYWRSWADRGRAPAHAPFAPGRWTTQAGASFAKDPSGSWNSYNGLLGYDGFRGGSRNEVWSFATASGSITCGVVRWQTIWSDPGGGPRQDTARRNWGPSVPPGSYRYMAETDIMQPCFLRHTGARTVVTSGQADPDTMEGVGTANSTGFGIAIAIVLIVWIAIVIGSLVMLIVALVDIVRRPDWQWKLAGQEKILWLLLVILVNIFAIPSLIYWFNIRKKLRAVADAAAAGAYGPGHMTYSGWEPFPSPLPQPVTAPPGWYPDSAGVSQLRWWDGTRWTEHTSPGSPGSP